MTRGAFVLGWLLVGLVVPADLAQAQNQIRSVLWTKPPLLGMYARDSARVDESLPEVHSAEWPTFYIEALAELRACSRVYEDLRDWTIYTVTAQAFFVRFWREKEQQWVEDEPFVGFTFPHLKRIYVVQAGLHNRGLIKHEMLHAVLAARGFDPAHTTPVADGMFRRCFKGD
jgi:hypothetical protein